MATTANPGFKHARKVELPSPDGAVRTVYVVSTDIELDEKHPLYDKSAFDKLAQELVDYCDEDPAEDQRGFKGTTP